MNCYRFFFDGWWHDQLTINDPQNSDCSAKLWVFRNSNWNQLVAPSYVHGIHLTIPLVPPVVFATTTRSSPATCWVRHSQWAPKVRPPIGSLAVPGGSGRHRCPRICRWRRTEWRCPAVSNEKNWMDKQVQRNIFSMICLSNQLHVRYTINSLSDQTFIRNVQTCTNQFLLRQINRKPACWALVWQS